MNRPQPVRLFGSARAYALARRSPLGQGELLPAPEVAPSSEEALAQIAQIAQSIELERSADASDYPKYLEAAKSRLETLQKQNAARTALSEQERIWSAAHGNQEKLQAAQAAYDQATAELAQANADTAALRETVDRHGKTILELRQTADLWIKTLPPELQGEGRRKIDPNWRPGPGGPPRTAPARAAFPYLGGIRLVQVPIAGLYRPRPAGPFLSQLVEVKAPQITIPISAPISTPINIDLGSLPLSVGFFAGSGITFLVRSGVPEGWPQTAATILGAGLAVAGVVNLFLKKAQAPPAPAPPPAAGPPPPPPAGAAASEPAAPPPFQPPSAGAFMGLQFELVSPKPDEEVKHLGWFLTGDRIPVALRMLNPSDEAATFNLEFEWEEFPSMIGYNLSPSRAAKAFQIALGPKEEKNETFELPIASGSGWSSIAVALSVYKKRTPTDPRALVVNVTFNVS